MGHPVQYVGGGGDERAEVAEGGLGLYPGRVLQQGRGPAQE